MISPPSRLGQDFVSGAHETLLGAAVYLDAIKENEELIMRKEAHLIQLRQTLALLAPHYS